MVTNFEYVKDMISKSEYGGYYTIISGQIEVDCDIIDTDEIVLIKDDSVEVRLVFCASDGSYITAMVEGIPNENDLC